MDQKGEFLLAVSTGNLQRVRELNAAGVDLNQSSDRGETPLMAAAKSGHTDIVKFLIDAGANLRACNYDCFSRQYMNWLGFMVSMR